MTAADANTWRRSVWEVLGELGMSFLRGGLLGLGAGLVTGGVLQSAMAYARLRSIRNLPIEVDEGLGRSGRVDFDIDDSGVSNVRVRLGPDISEADLFAHIDAAMAARSYGGMRGRARDALNTLRQRPGRGPGGFPPGSRAFEAEMELEKLQQMLDDRLRALQTSAQNGSIDPESVHILQAEIDVIEANVARFRGVVEEMDVAPGTGSIGRPDAPPGYPDPPEGHYYYRQGDDWDIRRYPESDAPAKMLLSDGQGGFELVFCDETYSFFPYELIVPCTSDSLVLYDDFGDFPDSLQGRLIAGFDVGRKRDNSELVIVEERGNAYFLRLARSYDRVPFAEQEADLVRMMNVLPIARLSIDHTDIGMHLTENLQRRFDVYIRAETFNQANKEIWCNDFRILLQQHRVHLPKDRGLVSQIHSIKKRLTASGNVSFDVEASGQEARAGHADRFWALALACQKERFRGTDEENDTDVHVTVLGQEFDHVA